MGNIISLRSANPMPDLEKLHRWAGLLTQRGRAEGVGEKLVENMIRDEVPNVLFVQISPEFILFAVRDSEDGPVFGYSFPNPIKDAQ